MAHLATLSPLLESSTWSRRSIWTCAAPWARHRYWSAKEPKLFDCLEGTGRRLPSGGSSADPRPVPERRSRRCARDCDSLCREPLWPIPPREWTRWGPSSPQGIVLEHGRLLVSTGHIPEAIPSLELATQLNPGDKQGWQVPRTGAGRHGKTGRSQGRPRPLQRHRLQRGPASRPRICSCARTPTTRRVDSCVRL